MSDRSFLDYSGLGYYTDKYNDQVNNITGTEYDSTATYSIDDYCIHDNKVYKCITAIDTAEEWTEAHWTHVDVTDEIYNMNNNIDMITNTDETHGPSSIVTFESEVDGAPIRKITADFSPVQDLHGYDHPWPPGGGKNLFNKNDSNIYIPSSYLEVNTGIYKQGVGDTRLVWINCEPNTTYTVSCSVTTTLRISSFNNKPTASGIGPTVYKAPSEKTTAGSGLTLTTGDNDHCIIVQVFADADIGSVTLESATDKLMVEVGENVTSWLPYSNICPIEGYTECKVDHTGKNLFDNVAHHTSFTTNIGSKENLLAAIAHNQMMFRGISTDSTGISSYTSSNQVWVIYPVISGKTYSTYRFTKRTVMLDADFNFVRNINGIAPFPGVSDREGYVYVTFTAKSYEAYMAMYVNNFAQGADVQNWTLDDVINEYMIVTGGERPTNYEPYQGETVTINWQDESGTAYGGTLTLNEDGSADLVREYGMKPISDWKYYTIRTQNPTSGWDSFQLYLPYDDIKQAGGSVVDGKPNIWSTIFQARTNAEIADNPGYSIRKSNVYIYLAVPADTYTSWNDFKTAFGDIPIVYPLATPQTYHLDSIDQLTTFLGTNNIWTSLNGDATVTVGNYLSTITSHIDGAKSSVLSVIAKDESSGIASTNYVANQFIIMNNRLYRVTANVASGAAFVIGTNCVMTTVGDQLTSLLNV